MTWEKVDEKSFPGDQMKDLRQKFPGADPRVTRRPPPLHMLVDSFGTFPSVEVSN